MQVFVCFFLININGVFNTYTYYAQKQTFKPLKSAALSHLKTGDLAGSLFTTTSWDGFPSCYWCKFTWRKLLISWNGRSFWLELPFVCVQWVKRKRRHCRLWTRSDKEVSAFTSCWQSSCEWTSLFARAMTTKMKIIRGWQVRETWDLLCSRRRRPTWE